MKPPATSCLIELHFLPCVQYLSKFLLYDKVTIEANENYQKGSYRNRCRISGANGIDRISIPLQSGKNQQQAITEVRIAYDEPWANRMWHTIQSAYGKSPFFVHYSDAIHELLTRRTECLFDLNVGLLHWLLDAMELPPFALSETYENRTDDACDDLRGFIRPKRQQADPWFDPVAYHQVFDDRHGFLPNLSGIDLLFALGPESKYLLTRCLPLDG